MGFWLGWVGLGDVGDVRGLRGLALHSLHWKWNGMGCLWKQYAGSYSARASEHAGKHVAIGH